MRFEPRLPIARAPERVPPLCGYSGPRERLTASAQNSTLQERSDQSAGPRSATHIECDKICRGGHSPRPKRLGQARVFPFPCSTSATTESMSRRLQRSECSGEGNPIDAKMISYLVEPLYERARCDRVADTRSSHSMRFGKTCASARRVLR